MKKIIIVFTLILTFNVNGQIAKDKKLHFIAGAITGGITNGITYAITKDEKKAFILGLGSAVGIGLAKEIKDQIVYGGFDSLDWFYTIAGGVSVNVPFYAIENLINKRQINKEL